MKIQFTKTSERDYDFCHDLSKENMYSLVIRHWGSWNSNLYKKDFNINETTMMMLNGKRIGFFRIKIEKGYIYIIDMQLKKDFQGKGYGRKMLELIEKMTIDKGLPKIKLSVFEDNIARKIYEKFGFVLINKKNFALEYEKNLVL